MIRIGISELKELLRKIDGKRYSMYKKLRNLVINYDVAKAILTKIQGDPHAPPSIMEITIPSKVHKLPNKFLRGEFQTPLTDYIARVLYRVTRKYSRKCGSGYSCYIGIPKPGPWILKRSCVGVKNGDIVLRMYIGLPARNRRVLGNKASELLIKHTLGIVDTIIELRSKVGEIEKHIECYIDQEYLRQWLYRNNYMFFIADRSILPRESSLSEKPMKNAILFKSPRPLRVIVRLPSGKQITGMAMPMGIAVITGGGYHGKTTLLKAIQNGIYNHVKGDGREYIVSRKYTVIIRAEDGRIVSNVDISSFINNLPTGEDTLKYSSLNSSGSTSMAASINEAIEANAEVILMDEDTSATNLLFKDEVMSKVIAKEPIKPLHLQIRDLVNKTKIGIVIVTSASSSFLDVADRIILMENYIPRDITTDIRKYAAPKSELPYKSPRSRVFHGIRGLRKIRAKDYRIVTEYSDGIRFELDLAYYSRIVEKGQVKFIAYIVKKLANLERPMSIPKLINYVNELISNKGFSAFIHPIPPDLTTVDGFDVVWVLNRLYNAVFIQSK